MSVTMTEEEQAFLRTQLEKCRRYLEFGCGESTIAAAGIENIERIVVVESDRSFAEKVLFSDQTVRSAVEAGRLLFHFIDIGPCGDWGRPKGNSQRYLWPVYALSPFSERRDYDFVFVDGIFRGACALASFLAAPDTPVLIHDFWNRKRYHFLLEFVDCKYRVDTMGFFIRKDGADAARMRRQLVAHQYLPDDESMLSRAKSLMLGVTNR